MDYLTIGVDDTENTSQVFEMYSSENAEISAPSGTLDCALEFEDEGRAMALTKKLL